MSCLGPRNSSSRVKKGCSGSCLDKESHGDERRGRPQVRDVTVKNPETGETRYYYFEIAKPGVSDIEILRAILKPGALPQEEEKPAPLAKYEEVLHQKEALGISTQTSRTKTEYSTIACNTDKMKNCKCVHCHCRPSSTRLPPPPPPPSNNLTERGTDHKFSYTTTHPQHASCPVCGPHSSSMSPNVRTCILSRCPYIAHKLTPQTPTESYSFPPLYGSSHDISRKRTKRVRSDTSIGSCGSNKTKEASSLETLIEEKIEGILKPILQTLIGGSGRRHETDDLWHRGHKSMNTTTSDRIGEVLSAEIEVGCEQLDAYSRKRHVNFEEDCICEGATEGGNSQKEHNGCSYPDEFWV